MSNPIVLFSQQSLNIDSPTFDLGSQKTIVAVGMQPDDYITFEVIRVNSGARSTVCGCRINEATPGSIAGIQELLCPACDEDASQPVRLTYLNPVVILDSPQGSLLRAIYHGDGLDMQTVTVWALESHTPNLTDSMRGCPPVCCVDETWVATGESRCAADEVEVQEISNCGNFRWVTSLVQPDDFWNPTGLNQCSLVNDTDTLQQEVNACGQIRWVAGGPQVWNETNNTRCVEGNIETQEVNQCGRTRWVAGGALVWTPTGLLDCSILNDVDTLQQESNQCGDIRWVDGPDQIWVETGATRPAGDGFEVQEANQCGRVRWVAGSDSAWVATGVVICSTVNDTDTFNQEINQAGRYRLVAGDPQVWEDTCCTRCTDTNVEQQQINQCGRTRWTVGEAITWTFTGVQYCIDNELHNQEANQCGQTRIVNTATPCGDVAVPENFELDVCWRALTVISEMTGDFIDTGDTSAVTFNELGQTFVALRVNSTTPVPRHDALFASNLNNLGFTYGAQIQQSSDGTDPNLYLSAGGLVGGPLIGVGYSVDGVNGRYQPGSSFTESLVGSQDFSYFVFKLEMADTTGTVGLQAYTWDILTQLKIVSKLVRSQSTTTDINSTYANDSVYCIAPTGGGCSSSTDFLFPGSQDPTSVTLPGSGVESGVVASEHIVTIESDAEGDEITEGGTVCWTVTLDTPVTGADLLITPTLSGTEQAVHTYPIDPVVIPIGGTVANFCVGTTDDAIIEGTLILCLDLLAIDNPRITNAPQSGCVNVLDNDVANSASVTTTTPNVDEGLNAVYRVTLSTAAPIGGITGFLAFSGTEFVAHPLDYPDVPYTVTVGNTTVDVPVITTDGDGVDGNTVLTATIDSVSGGYTIGGLPADVTVVDTDSPLAFSIPAVIGDCLAAPNGGGWSTLIVERNGGISYYSSSTIPQDDFWVSPASAGVGDDYEVQFNGGPWLALSSTRTWNDDCPINGCVATLLGDLNIRRTIDSVVVATRNIRIKGRGNYDDNQWVCP